MSDALTRSRQLTAHLSVQKDGTVIDNRTGKPVVISHTTPRKKEQVPPNDRPSKRDELSTFRTMPDGSLLQEWREANNGYWRVACTCTEFKRVRPDRLAFCQHTELMIREDLDVRDDLGKYRPQKLYVVVPIFVEPATEAYVHVEPVSATLAEAFLVYDETAIADHRASGRLELGFASINASRRDLQALVIEAGVALWQTQYNELTCEAPFHSRLYSEDPAKMGPNGEPTSYAVADMLSMLTRRMCQRCFENESVPSI